MSRSASLGMLPFSLYSRPEDGYSRSSTAPRPLFPPSPTALPNNEKVSNPRQETELLRQLCQQMIAAQHRETKLIEAIEHSLDRRDGRCPSSSSSAPSLSMAALSTTDQEATSPAAGTELRNSGSPLTVDANVVWCSERRRQSSSRSADTIDLRQTDDVRASKLHESISQLRLENAWYRRRVAALEAELQLLRPTQQSRGASAVSFSIESPSPVAPIRSRTSPAHEDYSNVLLHASTHRLLAEAEAMCHNHYDSGETSRFHSALLGEY